MQTTGGKSGGLDRKDLFSVHCSLAVVAEQLQVATCSHVALKVVAPLSANRGYQGGTAPRTATSKLARLPLDHAEEVQMENLAESAEHSHLDIE